MTDKLTLLKEYIALQACDEGLWFEAETASEGYLQQELRRIAWLIEKATTEQIKMEIENHLKEGLAQHVPAPEAEALTAVMSASYLLGMSMAALFSVQQHLIQGRDKEALTTVNDAVKVLNEKITRGYYGKEVKANADQG